MNLSKHFVIALLCLAPLLQGCSFLKSAIGLSARRPTVEVQSVEVTKLSLMALELQVTVQVDNPNDFALKLSRLQYNFTAGELQVAEGRHEEQISVPASGRGIVKLPLSLNASNVMKLLQMLADSASDPETFLTATADFDTPFGPIEVDFNDRRSLRKLSGMRF